MTATVSWREMRNGETAITNETENVTGRWEIEIATETESGIETDSTTTTTAAVASITTGSSSAGISEEEEEEDHQITAAMVQSITVDHHITGTAWAAWGWVVHEAHSLDLEAADLLADECTATT